MRAPPRPVEPWSHIIRFDDGRRTPIAFDLTPSSDIRAALAANLGIIGLRKLRFSGRLEPEGKRNWRLEAELGATAVQACVVTFTPVTTRIDESVERRFLADMPDLPEGDEIEMPDEIVEPLPAALDLGTVMAEALALALPAWPRAEGVELAQSAFAPPGKAPMTDDDARPFAALKTLIGKRDDGS